MLVVAGDALRKITGLNWLFHFRRTLGLYAFFYALTHFLIFFIFDRVLNVRDTLSEMVKRPYLIVGSVGLLAMAPLAATSFNYMIKRMGPKRWQALHRLAYVAAIAGVVHFYMLVKSDIRLPVAYGSVVAILLGYRAAGFSVRRLKKTHLQSNGSSAAAPGRGRWKGQLRVERIVQETPNVKTFRLVPPNRGGFPFAYLPGQYLTFSLQIGGKQVSRSYTIASTPSRPGYCEVTIKREEHGAGFAAHARYGEGRRPLDDRRAGRKVHVYRHGSKPHRAAGRGRRNNAADVDPALSDRSELERADRHGLFLQDGCRYHFPRGA